MLFLSGRGFLEIGKAFLCPMPLFMHEAVSHSSASLNRAILLGLSNWIGVDRNATAIVAGW